MPTRVGDFYRSDLHDVIKVAGIFTIHYFKYGQFFSYPTESHNFWEMVFIDSGEGVAVSGKEKIPLRQSQAIFHRPNTEHTILTGDSFCNSVIISFDVTGRMMSYFEDRVLTLNDYEKGLLKTIVTEGKSGYKDKLNLVDQKRMEKRDDAPFGSDQVIKNSLELLLISLIRAGIDNRSEPDALSVHGEQVVKKIVQILNDRVYSSVSLEDISKELFFSKTYIKSVFKRQMGTSIIQYYNKLRIDEAKRLISMTKYSFTEIAKKMNFSSVHYFTRLFKSITQMTPTEYQHSIQADNVLD